MRTILITLPDTNFINLSEILSNFKGIVICYKDSNAVGYIINDDVNWCFYNSININSSEADDTILYKLVRSLIDNKICNTFKVIEFK